MYLPFIGAKLFREFCISLGLWRRENMEKMEQYANRCKHNIVLF